MRASAIKSKRYLFEGRSLPINTVLIVTHAILLSLTCQSFLSDTPTHWIFKSSYSVTLIFLTAALVFLKGLYLYAYLARFALGLVLIISGFSKLNDPLGFAYLLNNYFQDGALNLFVIEKFGWNDFSLESYQHGTLRWAVGFAIGEILLGVMLLFHQLYKLAVWLSFGLIALFTFVSWSNYTCEEQSFFESVEVVRKGSNESIELLLKSSENKGVQMTNESKSTYTFKLTKARICADSCGCLGSDHHTFFGIDYDKKSAFLGSIMLLFFSLILIFTQFKMLANSALENTLFAIFTWIFILIYGIMNSWFWIVFLSAIVFYLALNIKRFGLRFLHNPMVALAILASLLLSLAYYVISYEPLSDFRKYAVGNDLSQWVAKNDTSGRQKIYIYRDNRSGKERFLSEEQQAASMISEDPNYDFIRLFELETLGSLVVNKQFFNPLINVRHLSKQRECNSLTQTIYEICFEDLVEVKNKKSKEVTIYRKADFPSIIENDSNYIVNKYSGVPADLEFVSAQELILNLDLVFVWVVKNLSQIEQAQWGLMKKLTREIVKEGNDVVVFGSADISDWEAISKYSAKEMAYFNMDRSELLKICRSNVCLMILKKGVVAGKYPLSGLPKYETITTKIQ